MIKYIFLGAIQGLTEFLPVSSSGHLVIAQHFLGIDKDVVFLDCLLHIGTIFALFTFFFKDILETLKSLKMLKNIALVTLITGAIGITFKDAFEALFHSAHSTAWQLLINGVILSLVPLFKEKERSPGTTDSAVMGVAQGISIIPGISRSGLTIVSLLARGIKKEEAFRFSFIASIPAIIGAFLLETKNVCAIRSFSPSSLSAGLITSYIFGLLALIILKNAVKKQKLQFFGYYCIALSLVLLYILRI